MKTATTLELADTLGVSRRRIRHLLSEGRLQGAVLEQTPRGPVWIVPVGKDGRPTITKRRKLCKGPCTAGGLMPGEHCETCGRVCR